MRTEYYYEKLLRVRDRTLDLLFPPRCPICDEAVPYPELICPECRKKLRYIKEPVCLKCGKRLQDEREEYCRGCLMTKHLFTEGRGLFEYQSAARSMYRFKYAGRQEYARFYAEEIERRLGKKIRSWQAEALVPVPIHYTRKRQRGYNQAERLAAEIGRRMHIPVERHLLIRVKKTLPQKQLGDAQRQNNLKKAFKIGRNDVKLKKIIIVDDIYTTGSTIDACAEELKKAGVERIYYISAAIGKGLR